MITIDQLLKSVDLGFEPRWVTKSDDNWVIVWAAKPFMGEDEWYHTICRNLDCGYIKLAEFDGKDWTECIYEVPRKTTGNIEKLLEQKLTIGKTKYEYPTHAMLMGKINELVDAVNELKAKFTLPTLNPDLTDEDLRNMMRDPKYWRDKDPEITQKIQNGFNRLYGDKN